MNIGELKKALDDSGLQDSAETNVDSLLVDRWSYTKIKVELKNDTNDEA